MYDFQKHWEASKTTPEAKKIVALEFLQPAIAKLQKTVNKLRILDAGCGDGVHAEVLNGLNLDHHFLGVDISNSALESAKKKNLSRWNFEISNLGKLPYEDDTFDISISFGVINYTNDPRRSFSELCRVTKKGGLIGIWVYPKREDLMGFIFYSVRKACGILGPKLTQIIADCIVPFMWILPTSSKLNLSNATWKECREVILVSIAPRILRFYHKHEIELWFSEESVMIESTMEDMPITLWGVKC